VTTLEIVFITHIVTSFYMAGLCWFVQVVHYPLFREIPLADFPKYERKNFVTGYVTVPIMIIELATGLYLLYHNQTTLYFVNTGFLVLIVLSTAIFQVPIHFKLTKTATSALIDKLIHTNWMRTISWTIRIAILAILLSQNLAFPE